MGRGRLPGVLLAVSLLLLFFLLPHAIEIGPQLPLGHAPGGLALGILHFFEIVIFLFFVVIAVGFLLDGE